MKRFSRTIRDVLKRSVFEKGDCNWIDRLSVKTKQYNNPKLSATKITPTKGSSKTNEGFASQNLLDKRKNFKPKFQVNNLVRATDLLKTFSEPDTTNWSYIFF